MKNKYYRTNNNKKIITYLISIFSFILIFENLIRHLLGDSGSLINVIKVGFCIILIFISIIDGTVRRSNKYINLIFITFIIILLLKILKEGTLYYFTNWIFENNNINYIMWYVYFFVFSQIYDKVDKNIVFKHLKVFSFIIIIISFYFFITNNYYGMVSYEFMLEFNWVGTNLTRMMSIFSNPNHAGLYFLLMLLILDLENIKNKTSILNINTVLLIICNILTFSRTSIICLMIYLIFRNKVYSKYNSTNKQWGKILKRYRYFLYVISGLLLISIIINNFNIYFFKIKNLLNNTRLERWKIGIDYMNKYILIGTPFSQKIEGIGNRFESLIFSDNLFIEVASRFGIILPVLISSFIISKVIIYLRKGDFIMISILLIFIIASLLSGTIHFSTPLYLFIYYCFIRKSYDIK